MIVKLVEATKSGFGDISLQLEEVYINTEQVVCVRPDPSYSTAGVTIPEGMSDNTQFSKVFLDHGQNGIAITVVGPPALIESKINTAKRQLLKG
tara:strand:- start:42 stop:323 length:282 start_codon:yes stop_codon:yes gene_type:complete